MSRRILSAHLLLIALGLLLAPAALGDALTPESSSGSPNAKAIDDLYKFTLVIAAVVFLAVEGALFYALFKYRARKGAKAAQIHGNTNLEIGWTVAAAVICVVLTIATFVKLGEIEDPAATSPGGLQLGQGVLAASTDVPEPPEGKALEICVTGRQYIWRYTYGPCSDGYGKPYSYEEMVVPADTTVVLDITSTDVNHSWWIPDLGGKMDAIQGYHNYTWFKAPKAGETYVGQCAELCGRNHPNMTARVRVVSPTEYESYIDQLGQDISTANQQAQESRDEQQSGIPSS